MKKVKFSFVLTAKGSLANVFFYPEKESLSILLTSDLDRKKWTNEGFELLVANPFEYELAVFGITGTDWEAQLFIDGQESPFIEWKGETGDTRRNVSIRTKPEKDV